MANLSSGKTALIVAVQDRVCALPLRSVVETMRPLPVEPVAGAPTFIVGVSIIRGIPTPVVDLGAVLGARHESAERVVTVRLGDKQVALLVGSVLGVRDLDTANIHELPSLLAGASHDVVETIGTLDERMLMVLQDGWHLPAEVWEAIRRDKVVS